MKSKPRIHDQRNVEDSRSIVVIDGLVDPQPR
jgi:hypothetical protein